MPTIGAVSCAGRKVWTMADVPANPSAESGLVELRAARANDLPALVALRDKLNALERAGCPHAPIVRLSVEEFTAVWGGTFDSPDHCWRVLQVGPRLIGFGLIYLVPLGPPPPGAFIHWAYLEPEYRRLGLGQALLDHLLDWARSRGADRVELQFIDGNEAAQHFWAKMGFQTYARKCVRSLAPSP